jgi:hypothetical protein
MQTLPAHGRVPTMMQGPEPFVGRRRRTWRKSGERHESAAVCHTPPPGGSLTWLAAQYVPGELLRDGAFITAAPQTASWLLVAAFLIASYTLGDFVFMLSAQLDHTYRRVAQACHAAHPRYHVPRRPCLAGDIEPRACRQCLTPLKWAKAYILVNAQHARIEIDRLEAEQKFFRSLAAVVLGVLAYHCSLEQRWKGTELLYALPSSSISRARTRLTPPGRHSSAEAPTRLRQSARRYHRPHRLATHAPRHVRAKR